MVSPPVRVTLQGPQQLAGALEGVLWTTGRDSGPRVSLHPGDLAPLSVVPWSQANLSVPSAQFLLLPSSATQGTRQPLAVTFSEGNKGACWGVPCRMQAWPALPACRELLIWQS